MTAVTDTCWVRVAALDEVPQGGVRTVNAERHTIAIFRTDDGVFAVDNRCPHMGFPLDRGTVDDCVLTCHWHHARFDLTSGGTFDSWADDARVFPVDVRDEQVWVNVAAPAGRGDYHRQRMRDGLQRDIPLIIGKSVIAMLEAGEPDEAMRIGLEYGVRERRGGWGPGLTMLVCMANLLPVLEPEERARALYHGLSAVARDTAGSAPRLPVQPLPDTGADTRTLARWFRRFVEVRDAEGAERCLATAIGQGASNAELADMLFTAATDHRYLSAGHVVDFTNKAFEALDAVGNDMAELVLTSLVAGYANAGRMEETSSWRSPIDLPALLRPAFEAVPSAIEAGRARQGAWSRGAELTPILLGEDPATTVDTLVQALRDGCAPVDLAGCVAYAAALRIAWFHTSNEFGDWDRALHTFSFANAVQQGLRRTGGGGLVRGVFDAAMSVYLDRFLNIPPAQLPGAGDGTAEPTALLAVLADRLDQQQQVNEAGAIAVRFLAAGGEPARLQAALGSLLLREDRDFHTVQVVEAAIRQFAPRSGSAEGSHVLAAGARYLAAHAPTARAQGQTFRVAQRLHRGERLYEAA